MKTPILILTIFLSLSANANFIGRLIEKGGGGPKELPNCDSEYMKDRELENDYPSSYWMNQLNKAVKRDDYCRQAQLWWHFYLVQPKYFMDNDGWVRTIEALYHGRFFLELQWQIKNYRKEKGHKEIVDYIQVSSYWTHLDDLVKRDAYNKCLNPRGYYENPINGDRYSLIEEAFMSSNDFIKRYPDSKYTEEVEKKREWIKDLNGRLLLCNTKNTLQSIERKKGGPGPHNYWAIYKRLAQIVANYQESQAIEESLYLMIYTINRIEILTKGESRSTVDESYDFLYKEDWRPKFNKLVEILLTEYPNSPWADKIRQSL